MTVTFKTIQSVDYDMREYGPWRRPTRRDATRGRVQGWECHECGLVAILFDDDWHDCWGECEVPALDFPAVLASRDSGCVNPATVVGIDRDYTPDQIQALRHMLADYDEWERYLS